MNTSVAIAIFAIVSSGFINALAAIAASGIRMEMKALRELIEYRLAEMNRRVDAHDERLEKFEVKIEKAKGAHA